MGGGIAGRGAWRRGADAPASDVQGLLHLFQHSGEVF